MQQRCDTRGVNQAAILQKEERPMATTTLGATSNTPVCPNRDHHSGRILVVGNNDALDKALLPEMGAERRPPPSCLRNARRAWLR
jgi:hypothetical protein